MTIVWVVSEAFANIFGAVISLYTGGVADDSIYSVCYPAVKIGSTPDPNWDEVESR
jgi:hypothetical protein